MRHYLSCENNLGHVLSKFCFQLFKNKNIVSYPMKVCLRNIWSVHYLFIKKRNCFIEFPFFVTKFASY